MRAITIAPGRAGSLELAQMEGPSPQAGAVLARTVALGVCGTDAELIRGEYGWAPPGRDRLVLGHEGLACVEEAPAASGIKAGDMIVPMVRQPDPVPCANCAVGEWDMCRNGRYREHGIKAIDGFGRERFAIAPDFVQPVAPELGLAAVLVEPASVVAKAWEHIEAIGGRAQWQPRRLLVTGAGPVGLLAALFGVRRGLDVHVLDRLAGGPKPGLVRDLGATYHVARPGRHVRDLGLNADVIIECTGAATLIVEAIESASPNGVICLAGISAGGHRLTLDMGMLNRCLVLENVAIIGSVSANRRHYQAAAAALAAADRGWLSRLISRQVPLARWREAYERRSEEVKTVIAFASGD